MSWEATAYVKSLDACPDGAPLSRGQKLLLFVLADYHNTAHRAAWPSVPTLAGESLTSLAQVKRDLAYAEEHLVIERRHPEKMGRGWTVAYAFLKLDDPDRLQKLLKGAHGEPLFCPEERGSKGAHGEQERGLKGAHGEQERGSKGAHGEQRNKEELRTLEPMNPTATKNSTACAALKTWLAIKQALEQQLPLEEFKLWVRPAYLLKVMPGNSLLIALPPNSRIAEQARARLPALRELAQSMGYAVNLTRYPDEFQREEIAIRYPEFYSQMFGAARQAQ